MKQKLIFSIIMCSMFFNSTLALAKEDPTTLLKGVISLTPIPTIDNPPEQLVAGQIQSGIEVAVQLKVKNEGQLPSQPGTVFVQYHVPSGLALHHLKPLFETEVLPLASLNPGEEKTIQFAKKQRMPTLYDFIRDDWGKREYQAIAQFKHTQKNLGILSLTFSAYYYEAPVPMSLAAVPAIHTDR